MLFGDLNRHQSLDKAHKTLVSEGSSVSATIALSRHRSSARLARRLALGRHCASTITRILALKSIDDVWKRICALEGEMFQTKTGRPFTFTVSVGPIIT